MTTAKSVKRALNLQKDDHIVTAWPEYAAGPGWSNALVWVIVANGDKKLRTECLQPSEQTREIQMLFMVANAAHNTLLLAIDDAVRKKK